MQVYNQSTQLPRPRPRILWAKEFKYRKNYFYGVYIVENLGTEQKQKTDATNRG